MSEVESQHILSRQGNANQNPVRVPFPSAWATLIRKAERVTVVGEKAENLDPSYTAGGSIRWYRALEKFGSSCVRHGYHITWQFHLPQTREE